MSKNALRNKKRREKQKEKKAAEASGSPADESWSVLDLFQHFKPPSITDSDKWFLSIWWSGHAPIHVYTVWNSS